MVCEFGLQEKKLNKSNVCCVTQTLEIEFSVRRQKPNRNNWFGEYTQCGTAGFRSVKKTCIFYSRHIDD